MRELTLAELEGASAQPAAAHAFHMDEQAFRLFYERTCRPLWSYLSRISGDAALAEDLVQESYYRFLRADLKSDDEAYQKNYLFRIGTNLARDYWRRHPRKEALVFRGEPEADNRVAESNEQRSELGQVLERIKPREREILWLAYVEGLSHKEIADVVGLKAGSIRLLLFRARRKLARMMREDVKGNPGKVTGAST